jgi:hypothetical protein
MLILSLFLPCFFLEKDTELMRSLESISDPEGLILLLKARHGKACYKKRKRSSYHHDDEEEDEEEASISVSGAEEEEEDETTTSNLEPDVLANDSSSPSPAPPPAKRKVTSWADRYDAAEREMREAGHWPKDDEPLRFKWAGGAPEEEIRVARRRGNLLAKDTWDAACEEFDTRFPACGLKEAWEAKRVGRMARTTTKEMTVETQVPPVEAPPPVFQFLQTRLRLMGDLLRTGRWTDGQPISEQQRMQFVQQYDNIQRVLGVFQQPQQPQQQPQQLQQVQQQQQQQQQPLQQQPLQQELLQQEPQQPLQQQPLQQQPLQQELLQQEPQQPLQQEPLQQEPLQQEPQLQQEQPQQPQQPQLADVIKAVQDADLSKKLSMASALSKLNASGIFGSKVRSFINYFLSPKLADDERAYHFQEIRQHLEEGDVAYVKGWIDDTVAYST